MELAQIVGRRRLMTKFAVERLNPDWTGQGMGMIEVMELSTAV